MYGCEILYSCIVDFIIGFVDPLYSTPEETGFVTLPVEVRTPGVVLDDDFVVRLETRDLTGLVNAAESIIFHLKITHH